MIDEVLAILYRSILLAIVIGALLILLQGLIIQLAVGWMSASEEIIAGKIALHQNLGAPATLMTYALLGDLLVTVNQRIIVGTVIIERCQYWFEHFVCSRILHGRERNRFGYCDG